MTISTIIVGVNHWITKWVGVTIDPSHRERMESH